MSIIRGNRGPDRIVGTPLPLQISNLYSWWNTDEFAGIADGTAIGSWTDLSGNGHPVSQGNTANKPTLKQGIRAGRPVLRFDGGDGLLGTGITGTSLTMVVVANATGSPGFFINNGDGETSITLQYNAGMTIFTLHSVADLNGPAYSAGTWIRMIARGRPSGSGGCNYLLNGGQVAANSGATPNSPSGGLGIGCRSGFSYHLTGDIGEALLYSKYLSEPEAASLDSYLIARWGF